MTEPDTEAQAELEASIETALSGSGRRTEDLLPVLYDDLRRLAASRLRPGLDAAGMRPTELLHDAYLRLASGPRAEWNGRGHFFGAAARAMRNVLVDRARAENAVKRGGAAERQELNSRISIATGPSLTVLDLDECLRDLAQRSPRAAEIVELRYFAGASIDETAEALELSTATVEREWKYAKAWLRTRLGSSQDGG